MDKCRSTSEKQDPPNFVFESYSSCMGYLTTIRPTRSTIRDDFADSHSHEHWHHHHHHYYNTDRPMTTTIRNVTPPLFNIIVIILL